MKFLQKLLLITISLALTDDISCQYGIRTKYNVNTLTKADEGLDEFFNDEAIARRGFGIGLDYWFRLKNYRVEFMPELYYGMNTSDFESEFITSSTLSRFGFNFNTHFYLMDLEEDCDSPTFSKEGPNITKGLFFHISPGVSYDMLKMDSSSGQVNNNEHFNLKIGGGIGLDIGVSDLLTITPIYTYNYFFGGDWVLSNFPNGAEPILNFKSTQAQHQFALRVGIRLDYK